MKKYNISHVGKVASIGRWINPTYGGSGDLIVREFIGEVVNDPKNFKADFPDYCYVYKELHELKRVLNECKNRLNPIKDDVKDEKVYSIITNLVRVHDDLRGQTGVIVTRYGGEIVTNAWLKMYELCSFIGPLLAAKSTKVVAGKTVKKLPDFSSFHIAEAPGNFVLAINHYICTNHPARWQWHANSYKNLYGSKDSYFDDKYGLIEAYPKKWLFGADGDGDITSSDNIKSFAYALGGSVDLVTSDVKYVPAEIDFDEEENINIPVHLGHFLASIETLARGGIMILKEFTFFEAQSISLLWLMNCCFDELWVVKPVTSRPANSEVYIVGVGFNGLRVAQVERLHNLLKYIRFLNKASGSPALFMREDVPDEFVQKIVAVMKELVEMQSASINRNLELWQKYKRVPYRMIKDQYRNERKQLADEWIDANKLKKLESNNRMMKRY